MLIGIYTFQANRGYELAEYVKKNSNVVVVMGGLHASMNCEEACRFCRNCHGHRVFGGRGEYFWQRSVRADLRRELHHSLANAKG